MKVEGDNLTISKDELQGFVDDILSRTRNGDEYYSGQIDAYLNLIYEIDLAEK